MLAALEIVFYIPPAAHAIRSVEMALVIANSMFTAANNIDSKPVIGNEESCVGNTLLQDQPQGERNSSGTTLAKEKMFVEANAGKNIHFPSQ